jgi:hypothetical protein
MFLAYDTFDNLENRLENARGVQRVKLAGSTVDEWTADARNRCALIPWHSSSGWDGKKYPANPRLVSEVPIETDGGGLPATVGPDPEWLSQFAVEAESYDDPVTQMVLDDISNGRQPGGLRRRFEVAYLIASDCVVHDEKTGDLRITDKGRACLEYFSERRA